MYSAGEMRGSAYQVVVVIRENHHWLEGSRFFLGHAAVRDDNDNVADLHPAGSRAIEAYHARTAFAFDDICNKAFTIVVVHNVHLFILYESRGVDQILVDRDAANVVQFRLSHLNPVNLRFHYCDLHYPVVLV